MNTPRRKHMTKALARGSKKTVVDDCFKDSVTYEFVKRKLSRIITSEIKVCCSTAVGSVMRSLHNCDLREFCWKKLNEEMTTHAPLLTYILQSCLNIIIVIYKNVNKTWFLQHCLQIQVFEQMSQHKHLQIISLCT